MKLLDANGLAIRRDLTRHARELSRQTQSSSLVRLLPGIYTSPTLAGDTVVRLAAAQAYHPDVWLTGTAAARVSWWPEIDVPIVTAACAGRLSNRPGFSFSRRCIDPDLLVEYHGWRVTHPALTALDLVESLGGNALDEGFRRGAISVASLRWAIDRTPGRPGNQLRRWLVDDSRDAPWSELEREGHRLLRDARLTGWETNARVRVRGQNYLLDAAFRRHRVGIEFDGWRFHSERDVFESDRIRNNALTVEGWRIFHFTAATLATMVDTIRPLVT